MIGHIVQLIPLGNCKYSGYIYIEIDPFKIVVLSILQYIEQRHIYNKLQGHCSKKKYLGPVVQLGYLYNAYHYVNWRQYPDVN